MHGGREANVHGLVSNSLNSGGPNTPRINIPLFDGSNTEILAMEMQKTFSGMPKKKVVEIATLFQGD